MSHWHIFGAGAMGSLIAYRMQHARLPCTLLHHHEGESSRLLIDGQSSTQLPIHTLDAQAPGSIKRLLITTKAGQLLDALKLAMPYLSPNAVIACTANGLGFDEGFKALLPQQNLYRAVSTAAAYRDHRAAVHVVATGSTRMGPGKSAEDPPNWFRDSLAMLEGWCWEPCMELAIGEKFSINCVINPLTAKLKCLNGQLLLLGNTAGPELRSLCEESEPALKRLGLWRKHGDLLDAAVSVCRSTAKNQSSMLQDTLAGRPTEINYLNAELLRRAHSLGLELPLNQALVSSLS
ncbi:2-dehydropantoate 2-reductase [Congregibacter variabilis]|uniref:2-dehydropantoate 2-reductase n=1 Tax=Congregibacter variabilis TaxID=3081200 RepID=A0ABZ0I6V7_9GAMM|nr:2-dehydropantoate 2-reductase [Congregibacter sp. IMCC43200]